MKKESDFSVDERPWSERAPNFPKETPVEVVDTQELYCECGGGCGKMVTMPVTKFLDVLAREQVTIIVAINCTTPPAPTDKELERGETYIIYEMAAA